MANLENSKEDCRSGIRTHKDHSCGEFEPQTKKQSASAASKISRTEESKFLDNIREGQKKLKDEKEFNPEHKYGNCLGFACSIKHFDEKTCSAIKKLLITAMEKIVPVEYRKKVLFIVRKFDMGREINFSWYFDLRYKSEGEDYHGFILVNE